MSVDTWLLDSDAAACMCRYGLIDDLAMVLGVSLSDFRILPQLKFQLLLNKPSKALKRLGTQAAVDEATRLVEQAGEVVILAESANVLLLKATPDIDGGELALFAALCDDANSGLITGDKRALIALSKVDDQLECHLSWARILCLEEAMALLVRRFGVTYLSEKVRAHPDANAGLSLIFGRSSASSAKSVEDGFKSFLNELVLKTSGKYTSPHLDFGVGSIIE